MAETTVEVKAFDLFCGIGGLTYGLQQAGITVSGGLDMDESCKYAYEHNCRATFLTKDIRNIHYQNILYFLKDADYSILVGCAPCQPFSTHAQKVGDSRKDGRWNLIREFSRIIEEGKPDIVSMENVPGIKKETVFKDFISKLEQLGYFVAYDVLNCHQFGVPQRRRRLVLLGSLLGPINLPEPSNVGTVTVRQAIGSMPALKNGGACKTDNIHTCSTLTSVNLERIKTSVPGGSWKDWPTRLLPPCYRKATGQTYSSVYGRMQWDGPAPTLTTQFYRYGTGRYGHPEQDRALSLREGALLQTFPKDYKFLPPGEPTIFSKIGRHIGNAVPPALAKEIGKSILEHVHADHEQRKSIHPGN